MHKRQEAAAESVEYLQCKALKEGLKACLRLEPH